MLNQQAQRFTPIIFFSKSFIVSALTSESESESLSEMANSLRPHGQYSPWNSPGQNTGVGSRYLLQGILLTQGSNPGLPYSRQTLYQMSHQGSPNRLNTQYQLFKLFFLTKNYKKKSDSSQSSFSHWPLNTDWLYDLGQVI